MIGNALPIGSQSICSETLPRDVVYSSPGALLHSSGCGERVAFDHRIALEYSECRYP
jgi:hypothetical protein